MAPTDSIIAFCSDPTLLLRFFYLAASALVLFIQAVPALRSRFLAYGSRATPTSPTPTPKPASQPQSASSPFSQLLDYLTSIRVPHNWFTHFYILSTVCGLCWAYQLSIGGTAVQFLADFEQTVQTPNDGASTTSMTIPQIQLVWLLMLLQSIRRLLESYVYTSKSSSQMWLGHYLLGLLFYLATNTAVFIEGVPALWSLDALSAKSSNARCADDSIELWKTAILIPAILATHILQNSYHAYLYELRSKNTTYQLPSHPFFPRIFCPHYTLEVLIYVFLSLLAAPQGKIVNWTIASAAVFTAVNLGVTATGTKRWYVQRFGKAVDGWSKMIPGIW